MPAHEHHSCGPVTTASLERSSRPGGLEQASIADAAGQFPAAATSNRATPAELAAGVTSPYEAAQVDARAHGVAAMRSCQPITGCSDPR
jgi:hypothetical protein